MEDKMFYRLMQIETVGYQPLDGNKLEMSVDAARNAAFQLQFCVPENNRHYFVVDEALKHYECTVNSSDAGLENVTRTGALSLCPEHINDRDHWSSVLTKDNVFTLDGIVDFISCVQTHFPATSLKVPDKNIFLWPGSGNKGEVLEKNHIPFETFQVNWHQPDTHSSAIGGCSGVTNSTSEKVQSIVNTPEDASFSSSSLFNQSSGRLIDDNGSVQQITESANLYGWKSAHDVVPLLHGSCSRQSPLLSSYSYSSRKKSLGTRGGLNNRFVPPVISKDGNQIENGKKCEGDETIDDRLKGIDAKFVELISNEIMEHRPCMNWEDIAGLEFAKNTIKEIVVWPLLRPDIFNGLRGPPKGLLLFGPPGTGKTLIGKCIASQSKSTFFCISASSLTSKWVGEGEKMVRALFAVARCHQPAVIFIDEVDSVLSHRSNVEHEASRRIKTEFLIHLVQDGASTSDQDRILVIGATNRPQEIDEAARRRFVKRLYIPLPECVARRYIVHHLMAQENCQLNEEEICLIADRTEGYSGADMANLCREAALGPIRSIPVEEMVYVAADQVPAIVMKDFLSALDIIRPTVSKQELDIYVTWNNTYGSFAK